VYRKPSAPFDAWLGHAFAADCVEVADAVHARRELRALADRIAADLESWHAKGLEIATVSAAEDGSVVRVVTTDVARARQAVTRRYGGDAPIEVVFEQPPRPL